MIPIPGFRSRTPWKMALASFVYVVVLMIIVITIVNPSSDKPIESQEITQTQIDDFITWYNNIINIRKVADTAMSQYEAIAKKLDETGDVYSAYSSFSHVKTVTATARNKINELKIPESLSKNHQESLREAQSDLSAGLWSRMQGVDNLLKYLDNPRPSLIESAKLDFTTAESLMTKGIAKIVTIQSELNIAKNSNVVK